MPIQVFGPILIMLLLKIVIRLPEFDYGILFQYKFYLERNWWVFQATLRTNLVETVYLLWKPPRLNSDATLSSGNRRRCQCTWHEESCCFHWPAWLKLLICRKIRNRCSLEHNFLFMLKIVTKSNLILFFII